MAEISFSLGRLFEEAFGYKSSAFEPKLENRNSGMQKKRQGNGGSPYYANSAMGTEYFMPVSLYYPDTTVRPSPPPGKSDDKSSSSFTKRKKWQLPYPVVTISSKKTIVETPLTERGGTLKELINIQDYEIVVKGLIIGTDGNYPEKEMSTLRGIYEQNVAISIECPLTDIFLLRPDRNGSDQVVIKELSFPANQGVSNVCPYVMKLFSDEPFNLTIIE